MYLIDLSQSVVVDPDLAAAASLLIWDQELHLICAVFTVFSFLLCRDYLSTLRTLHSQVMKLFKAHKLRCPRTNRELVALLGSHTHGLSD